MILFTIVKTKIVHYSSLTYFPLSFLAAYFVYELSNNRAEIKRYLLWILLLTETIFLFSENAGWKQRKQQP
jgi:TRAP-type mannitol/chloroaromatic compound transport system permease small subunit